MISFEEKASYIFFAPLSHSEGICDIYLSMYTKKFIDPLEGYFNK